MMPKDETPEFTPELLAAYADGELDAEMQAVVERWLVEHPEALGELSAQRDLGPRNPELWERAEAPEPSPMAWATVRSGIERGLNPSVPQRTNRWKVAACVFGGMLSAGIVAAVAWVGFGPIEEQQVTVASATRPTPRFPGPETAPTPRERIPVTKPDPLAEFAVLPMASDADVILDRVPDTLTGWLPIGKHPVPDTLVFATVEEVHLQEVDPSPVWPAGRPKMVTAPGDMPMIFAAKPR